MTAAARGSGVQDAKKNIRKKNQILVRITLVFFKHSFHPGVDFCWCFNFHFFCFCFVQLLVEDVDFFLFSERHRGRLLHFAFKFFDEGCGLT